MLDHASRRPRQHTPPHSAFLLSPPKPREKKATKQTTIATPQIPPQNKNKKQTNKQTTKKSYSQNTKNKNSFTGYNVAVVNAHTRHHTPPSFCLHRNLEKTTTNKQPVIEFYWT